MANERRDSFGRDPVRVSNPGVVLFHIRDFQRLSRGRDLPDLAHADGETTKRTIDLLPVLLAVVQRTAGTRHQVQTLFSVRALFREAATRTVAGQRWLRDPNADKSHGRRFRQPLNGHWKNLRPLVEGREFKQELLRVTNDSGVVQRVCHADIMTIYR